MPNIKVQPSGNVYEYEVGKTLLEVLLEEGIFVDNPCNGKGLCGKCKVRILAGELSEPEDTERKLLKQEEMENGVRLSCLVKPETDLEIELMQKERKHQVLTGGYIPSFAFDQDIQKIVVEIQKPTSESKSRAGMPPDEGVCSGTGDGCTPWKSSDSNRRGQYDGKNVWGCG